MPMKRCWTIRRGRSSAEEGRLAAIADALHRNVTGSTLPPPVDHDMLRPDETALFCIGAHVSGLPLSPQLTALGGRFLRAARTTAAYRLHARGNRARLVRSGQGAWTGAAIEGAVWALPTAAIGTLLGQVPPPLGFGNVTLADGPCLGFLAEAAWVEGTEDITGFGGWLAVRDAA
jgi:allophanate hydrolase